jgi:type IV pilus assembly protein PilM
LKTSTAVGLDIGSYSIKCVEVAGHNGAMELRRVSILPAVNPSQATLQNLLKLLFDAYMGKVPKVIISVSSGSSLLIRRISLPTMTAAELRGAVVYEAEGHIPFPVDQCLLDFQILDKSADGKNMNVLLVAAKKDFIQERINLLSTAGIAIDTIDVDMFCLVNAFEVLGDDGGQRVYGLLNVGHSMTSFAIIQEKQPFFVREISSGGLEITKVISEVQSISEEEADQMKIGRSPDKAEILKQATRKGFEALTEELKHSIDYFENETGEELKQIWMSGGGALAQDAPAILSEELGKEVQLWNNLKKINIFGNIDQKYLSDHSFELNVALGMVLRGLEPKK